MRVVFINCADVDVVVVIVILVVSRVLSVRCSCCVFLVSWKIPKIQFRSLQWEGVRGWRGGCSNFFLYPLTCIYKLERSPPIFLHVWLAS